MFLHGAEFKFIPQLSLKEQYNSNIFFDTDTDNKVHDVVTVLSPGLKLTDRTERFAASLQSQLNRYQYSEQQDLNATDQLHTGRFGYQLTEMMKLSAEAGYTKDSQVDRDIETTGLVLGTPIRRRNHYACSTDAALSEKTSLNASYSYDRDRFEDPEFVDSTIQDMSLTLAHNLDAFMQQTIGRISAIYTLYRYPDTDTDITDYTLMLGAGKKLTETIELSADVGRHLEHSRNELFHVFVEREKSRGTVGQVSLNYRGELTTGGLSYIQDVRSISGEAGTTRFYSLRLNVSRRFTYKLTGEFSADYYLNRQDRKQIFVTTIDEDTLRIQPRVVYNFTNDLNLEFSYRYIWITYNTSDQSATQNLFFVGITWQYPIPH